MSYSTPRVYLPRPRHLYHNWRFQQQNLEIDPGTLVELLAGYRLELKDSPQPLSGGNRGQSVLVITAQGKKVLKRYPQSLGHFTIVQEHSILTHLARVDFPAPRLVTTRSDETLVHHQDGYNYALFDFIEAGFQYYNYVLLPGQAQRFITIAGELLGRLHVNLKDFVPQGNNPDGFKSQHEDRWRNLDWIMARLADCITQTENANGNQSGWLLPQVGNMEKSLAQLDDVLAKADLPRLVIHADYGPYNLLFRPNGPAIVLDFEMARLDWRVTELVGAWYRFGHNKLGFRLNKMKWLLDAYQTHFPLSETELQFIPKVWQFLNIRQCIMNWHRYSETQTTAYLAKARLNLEMIEWMTAHQDEFLAELS